MTAFQKDVFARSQRQFPQVPPLFSPPRPSVAERQTMSEPKFGDGTGLVTDVDRSAGSSYSKVFPYQASLDSGRERAQVLSRDESCCSATPHAFHVFPDEALCLSPRAEDPERRISNAPTNGIDWRDVNQRDEGEMWKRRVSAPYGRHTSLGPGYPDRSNRQLLNTSPDRRRLAHDDFGRSSYQWDSLSEQRAAPYRKSNIRSDGQDYRHADDDRCPWKDNPSHHSNDRLMKPPSGSRRMRSEPRRGHEGKHAYPQHVRSHCNTHVQEMESILMTRN